MKYFLNKEKSKKLLDKSYFLMTKLKNLLDKMVLFKVILTLSMQKSENKKFSEMKKQLNLKKISTN
jgi:hypothetical protein